MNGIGACGKAVGATSPHARSAATRWGLALVGLVAGVSTAGAADLVVSGSNTIAFSRFEGTNFSPASVKLTLSTLAGKARFKLIGLPGSVTADRTTGTATTAGTSIRLTVDQSVARKLGVVATPIAFQNLDDPKSPPVKRTVELRSFASIARGTQVFDTRCVICHPKDRNGAGPLLRGVFARPAGSASGYSYSPALNAYNKVWTYPLLLSWLTAPETLVPGTRMFNGNVANLTTQQRHDLIAYLASVSKP